MHRIFVLLVTGLVLSAAEDGRVEDRLAIRKHIERIFEAFIHKDVAELRATHARNWLGYLEGSRSMVRGQEAYLDHSGHFSPDYGMKSYKIREFDIIFKGDAAFVAFVAEVESYFPGGGRGTRVLRITDFYVKEKGAWIQAGSDTDLHPESSGYPGQLWEGDRKSLLEAREAVWRAYFGGDRAGLEKLLPEERSAEAEAEAGAAAVEGVPAALFGQMLSPIPLLTARLCPAMRGLMGCSRLST